MDKSGIYIHIPFCKQACHYCNFHFSTSLKYKEQMLACIQTELELQAHYLHGNQVATIYFGGGTPSLLEAAEIQAILDTIQAHYVLANQVEISLEANPDDLTPDRIIALGKSPINRLSIGIQSFFDVDLQYMNRAHNAAEAATCIQAAQAVGFEDISIDLIYGSPTTSDEMWQMNLDKTMQLNVHHISAYCLTIEPNTALAHFIKKGTAQPVDDAKAARQFDTLMNMAATHDFEHYEISNFAKKGRYSKHNTAYWTGTKYLGVGPSAHSFDGKNRQWNMANNAKYMSAIQAGEIPASLEILSTEDRFNEYVMTSLRTQWGCDIDKLKSIQADYAAQFIVKTSSYIQAGMMFQKGNSYVLSQQGKQLADGIASDFFIIST